MEDAAQRSSALSIQIYSAHRLKITKLQDAGPCCAHKLKQSDVSLEQVRPDPQWSLGPSAGYGAECHRKTRRPRRASGSIPSR